MTVDWVQVLTVLTGIYAAVIAMFLVLENRCPQSTFAWLFLMLGFAIGGLILYTCSVEAGRPPNVWRVDPNRSIRTGAG